MAVVNSHTTSIIKFLRSQTDTVILFYSGGKDSIALLDMLSPHFKVNLVFMYLVEGLQHVEKYLTWAKTKYKVELKQFPHWMLSQYLSDNYYRFHTTKQIPAVKQKDIEAAAREHFNCEWIITGMKQTDSLNRKLMMRQFFLQAVDLKGKRAHPLSLWSKNEVISYLKLHRLPFPIQYGNGRSSGVDLTKECLSYLKKYYPGDYNKIIQVFPFAEMIIYDEIPEVRSTNNTTQSN